MSQPYRTSKNELFLLTMPPEKLLRTCAVLRRAQGNAAAYQRMVNRKRLGKIGQFLGKPNAILPPDIIVHFDSRVTYNPIDIPEVDSGGKPLNLSDPDAYELVALEIPMRYASLEVIDGQHRLYGFTKANDEARKSFNLVVLGIKGLLPDDRKDTFVVINDRSKRLNANLAAFLRYTDNERRCQIDPELMAIKIVVELNKVDPFKDRIKTLETGKQRITLKGFSGYALRGLLGSNGLLRAYYPNNSARFISALRLYFGLLKNTFKNEWREPNKYIIFTNRGIEAFLKLLKSILKHSKRRLTKKSVKKYLSALKKRWREPWETANLRNSYVGSKGWSDFHHDLVKAIRREIKGFEA